MKLLRNFSLIGILIYAVMAVILFSSCVDQRPLGACYDKGMAGYGYKVKAIAGPHRNSF